jgi:hypothetical protein
MLMFIALFMLGPATAIIVAIAAWKAWRHHRVALLWPALLAVTVEGAALWLGYQQIHYWDGWEFHPMVEDSAFLGTWRCHAESVSLGADGDFVTGSGERGRWSRRRVDGALLAGDLVWYPLRRNGELVLLPIRPECTLVSKEACSDADTWDKWSVCTLGTRSE